MRLRGANRQLRRLGARNQRRGQRRRRVRLAGRDRRAPARRQARPVRWKLAWSTARVPGPASERRPGPRERASTRSPSLPALARASKALQNSAAFCGRRSGRLASSFMMSAPSSGLTTAWGNQLGRPGNHLDMGLPDVDRRRPIDGELARHRLVEHHAQGVQVRPRIDTAAAALFRRHVVRRSDVHADRRVRPGSTSDSLPAPAAWPGRNPPTSPWAAGRLP